MFNKVILVGNTTREIELKNTPSGLSIANTAIATNRNIKNQLGEEREEVMFIDITFFGRTAEVANEYLKKGSKILVEGRLKLDQWTDSSGQKKSKHGLVVESMKMLGERQHVSEANTTDSGREDYTQVKAEPKVANHSISFSEEDLPF